MTTATDADFFGLEAAGAPGRHRFAVIERLARLDGRLYGGAAIGVSVAVAEATTERPVVWMTTQFVSTAERGAVVDVHTEVLAAGRRVNQVRVTATDADGAVLFASLGATGHHKPDGLSGQFERCPTVAVPDDAERWASPATGIAKAAGLDASMMPTGTSGFSTAVELREPAIVDHPDPGPGRVCLWMRRRDGVSVTPATAAYLADMVPMGVAHALGALAAGTSLDNTIRIGPFVDTEWILLDLRPHLAVGGYGHGIAHVWSEDGHLLATAGQTASMILYEPTTMPGADRPDRPDRPGRT